MNNKIKTNFISNLKNSFDEIQFALYHLKKDIDNWSLRFNSFNSLSKENKFFIGEQSLILSNEINKLINESLNFNQYLDHLKKITPVESELDSLLSQKKNLYLGLRNCLSSYSSIITCLNWQSPSVKSGLGTRIGLERETIKADWNDYKRDRSSDTFFVENLYKTNIFSDNDKNSVFHLFNGGMAAFTTIIYFLLCESIVKNKILISSQIYVESRLLLNKIFKGKISLLSHNNTEEIIKEIINQKPEVVFLEKISNTNLLRLFDVNEIISKLSKLYHQDIYFIIDTTCSFAFNDYLDTNSLPSNIKLIFHGSALKAPQLGLERVNAGYLKAINLEKLSEKILDYRTLSGTSIQDSSAYLIPATNKELICKRLKTIEANTIELAQSLLNIDPQQKIIETIVYPGLKCHPDYELSKIIGFNGFFFNIKFVEKYSKDKYYEMLTNKLINIAKAQKCDLVHGGSFGFNNTSVYYSVGWDEPENHYLRVSLGTETLYELDKIKLVFKKAFNSFKKDIIN